jgi:hypothetical protein
VHFHVNGIGYATPPCPIAWAGQTRDFKIKLHVLGPPKRNVEKLLNSLHTHTGGLSTGPGILVAQFATEASKRSAVRASPCTATGHAELLQRLTELCRVSENPRQCVRHYMDMFKDLCQVKLTLRLHGYQPSETQIFSHRGAIPDEVRFTMVSDGTVLPPIEQEARWTVDDGDETDAWVMRVEVEHNGKRGTILGHFGNDEGFLRTLTLVQMDTEVEGDQELSERLAGGGLGITVVDDTTRFAGSPLTLVNPEVPLIISLDNIWTHSQTPWNVYLNEIDHNGVPVP